MKWFKRKQKQIEEAFVLYDDKMEDLFKQHLEYMTLDEFSHLDETFLPTWLKDHDFPTTMRNMMDLAKTMVDWSKEIFVGKYEQLNPFKGMNLL